MIKLVGLLVISTSLMVGCATALEQSEVDSIVNCKNVSLSHARSILLRKGFSLSADEPDFIRTNPKAGVYVGSWPAVVVVNKNGADIKFELHYSFAGQGEPSYQNLHSGNKKEHLKIKQDICGS